MKVNFKVLGIFITILFFLTVNGLCDDVRKADGKQNRGELKKNSSAKSVNLSDSQFEIKLKSRRFTPSENIADAVQSYIRVSPRRRIHVLMQFKDMPNLHQKGILTNTGVNLLNYIPDKAWFVSVPKELTQAQLTNAGVRWIGPILPEDKIDRKSVV